MKFKTYVSKNNRGALYINKNKFTIMVEAAKKKGKGGPKKVAPAPVKGKKCKGKGKKGGEVDEAAFERDLLYAIQMSKAMAGLTVDVQPE